MTDVFDLKGKVAVVTGGVGGLGAAISLALATAGADIVVADLKLDAYKELEQKIKAVGRKSLAVPVDVTDEKSVADMVKKTLEAFPPSIAVTSSSLNLIPSVPLVTRDLIISAQRRLDTWGS